MARLIITSFTANGFGAVGCHGFYQNCAVYKIVDVDGIPYDPTITTSVRQQAIDGLVQKFNDSKSSFELSAEPDIIASDVEVMC